MEIRVDSSTDFEVNVEQVIRRQSMHWQEKLAHGISNLISPPIVAVIGIMSGGRFFGGGSLGWLLFYIVMVVCAPVGYILWLMSRGEITDFHIPRREQRTKPMLVMVGAAFVAWLVMITWDAPHAWQVLAGIGSIYLAFLLAVTQWWKISGHSAAIAGVTVFVVGSYGGFLAPVLLSVPLVAWARVRLQRHTLAQTIGGALTGSLFSILALVLMGAG